MFVVQMNMHGIFTCVYKQEFNLKKIDYIRDISNLDQVVAHL